MNRNRELRILNDHLARPGAGMFVLWGRRRIGKTSLLTKAIENDPRAAFHMASQSTVVDELARLSTTLARAWNVPLLEVQPLTTIDALMTYLASVNDRRLLVWDEFPYAIEAAPELPSLLQSAWDLHLKDGPLKLILSGSSVGMMEQTFFHPTSPLFGRRTGQLRLSPLGPHHVRHLFADWSIGDIVELAAIFGGAPGTLVRLDSTLSVSRNLQRHVLAIGEPLYNEVPFLLRQELREPRVYHAILAAVGGGATRFGEISSKVGLDKSNLSRYLATLAEMGLVARQVPVTERLPEKSRRGRYRIADPFVATWYRWVHPHRSLLERGLREAVWSEYIEPGYSAVLGQAVEPVIVELLTSSILSHHVPFPVAFAGSFWSSAVELDVVLLDASRKRAFIAEVKWTTRPVSPKLLADLKTRTARVPALAELDCVYALLSRSGFTAGNAGDNERLIDLDSERWPGP